MSALSIIKAKNIQPTQELLALAFVNPEAAWKQIGSVNFSLGMVRAYESEFNNDQFTDGGMVVSYNYDENNIDYHIFMADTGEEKEPEEVGHPHEYFIGKIEEDIRANNTYYSYSDAL